MREPVEVTFESPKMILILLYTNATYRKRDECDDSGAQKCFSENGQRGSWYMERSTKLSVMRISKECDHPMKLFYHVKENSRRILPNYNWIDV